MLRGSNWGQLELGTLRLEVGTFDAGRGGWRRAPGGSYPLGHGATHNRLPTLKTPRHLNQIILLPCVPFAALTTISPPRTPTLTLKAPHSCSPATPHALPSAHCQTDAPALRPVPPICPPNLAGTSSCNIMPTACIFITSVAPPCCAEECPTPTPHQGRPRPVLVRRVTVLAQRRQCW